MFVFEKFPVYQCAERLYGTVFEYFRLHKAPEYLKDQLLRALCSIVLNIAEGAGKYGKRDKRNFYMIARGSCHESAAAIKLLQFHEVDSVLIDDWSQQLELIGKMLSGLIRMLES